MRKNPEDVLGAVDRFLVVGVLVGAPEKRGDFRMFDPSGVCPGSVEIRSAGAVDGAGIDLRQRYDVFRQRGRVVGIEVQQSAPSAPDTEHLVSLVRGAVHGRLDAGVEPGDVSSAGQYSDPRPRALPGLRTSMSSEEVSDF